MKEHFLYDLHTHTSFSDGRNDMPTMLHAAESYGIRGMVFSDHTFSDEEAETLLRNYQQQPLPSSRVKLLHGTETTVADRSGKPAVSGRLLRKFDLVLMDSNGILFRQLEKLKEKKAIAAAYCETLINACSVPEVTIMAHPFNCGLAPLHLELELFTDEMVREVADAFVRSSKVFEVMNQMYYWHTETSFEHFHSEYSRIIRIMKEAGVSFSLGSDTHSCCGIGNFPWSRRVVEEQNLSDRLFLPAAFATTAHRES